MLRAGIVVVGFVAAASVTAALLALGPSPSAPPAPEEPAAPAETPKVGRIAVVVVDQRGAPMRGAVVELHRKEKLRSSPFCDQGEGSPTATLSDEGFAPPSRPEFVSRATTDGEGGVTFAVRLDTPYEVSLPAVVRGVRTGFAFTPFADDPAPLVHLWPTESQVVALRVMEGGHPVSGAVAEPASSGSAGWRILRPLDEGAAGASGEIRVALAVDETAYFDVRVPGRAATARYRVRLAGIPAELPWGGPCRLSGVVRDAKGAPQEGARVRVHVRPSSEPLLVDWSAEAVSDGSGRYAFESLPVGRASILVAGRGGRGSCDGIGEESDLFLDAQRAAGWDVTIRNGSIVRGVVRVEGAPVAAGEVELRSLSGPFRSRRAGLTERGEYESRDVPPGRYALFPRSRDYSLPSTIAAFSPGQDTLSRVPLPEATLALVDGGETAVRDLDVQRNVAIEGMIETPEGVPATGAILRLEPPFDADRRLDWRRKELMGYRLGVSASGGHFETWVPPVPPDWALVVTHPGGGLWVEDPSRLARSPGPVVLRLQARTTVVGHAVDERGLPWGGLIVHVDSEPECITLPDGTFRFDLLPWSSWAAWCAARGPSGPCSSQGFRLPRPGSTESRIEFPRLIRMPGTLLDERGRPIPGVNVTVKSADARVWDWTDARGEFLAFVPPRPVDVSALVPARDSWATVETTPKAVDPRLVATFRAALPPERPGRTLRVRVLDDSGHAVPICRVVAGAEWSLLPSDGRRLGRDVVGGNTRLALFGDPPWTVRVSAATDGSGRSLGLLSQAVRVDQAEDLVVVRLLRGADVAGRVLDEIGRGVPGVRVWDYPAERAATWTAADGAFHLGGFLPQETVRLAVETAGDYMTADLPSEGRGASAVLHVLRATSISGHVHTSSGLPADDLIVQATWDGARPILARSETRTDASGAFRIRGLPEGASVQILLRSWSPLDDAVERVTIPNVVAGSRDVEFVLPDAVAITGSVVHPDGSPFRAVRVEARTVARDDRKRRNTYVTKDPRWSDTSDERGSFRIGHLQAGSYLLRWTTDAGVVLGAHTPVAAPSSERFVLATERLSGKVLDANQPGWTVQVRLLDQKEDEDSESGRSPLTAGAFSLEVRPDRAYDLLVWNENGDDRYGVANRAAAGEVGPLSLREGGALKGRAEDAEGRPRPFVEVEAVVGAWRLTTRTNAEGKFHFRGVPPGTWRVHTTEYPRSYADDDVPANTSGLVLRPMR